ncbi:hypothetical protein MMJ53_11180 [Enterococcus cecorum]|uniref:hypothetical protein n=2 Tax=Enterococcus cecorum TaxID=44008 RepID=UPI000B241862|nr:hypothetical protein [Enterococcus cecorum]MCJ0544526.1 hypothetical protein [Enterococcus cecorum]MCJ0549305.1 hypothetical protein [Enterococcus cecorum]MCJ0554158.1 hypothetical protein [Enterococcus cecorum]MCJ0558708.1 hypothetical protein [Enterococcus cecorum]MCJ0563359.1 hypothetical protein [Enterococcus cecorum]
MFWLSVIKRSIYYHKKAFLGIALFFSLLILMQWFYAIFQQYVLAILQTIQQFFDISTKVEQPINQWQTPCKVLYLIVLSILFFMLGYFLFRLQRKRQNEKVSWIKNGGTVSNYFGLISGELLVISITVSVVMSMVMFLLQTWILPMIFSLCRYYFADIHHFSIKEWIQAPVPAKNIFQIKVPESENGLWQFIQNQIHLEKISLQMLFRTCCVNSLGLITVNSLIYFIQNLKKGRMYFAK